MVTTEAPPPFLRLPLELRLPIYEVVLNRRLPHNVKTFLSILSVCKQIREEVFPVLMKELRFFSDFPAFMEWTAKGNPRRLQYVRDLGLNMLDDPWKELPKCLERVAARKATTNRDLFEPRLSGEWWENRYAEMVRSEQEKAGTDQAIEDQTSPPSEASGYAHGLTERQEPSFIERLFHSLRAIGSTRRLQIHLRREERPDPPMEKPDLERELVLEMLPVAIPLLEELFVFSGITSLSYLRGLQNLKHLQFTGYSRSSPDETLSILNSLPRFESLSLRRWPEIYDARGGVRTEGLYQYQSVTPDVLRDLKPLKSLDITHLSSKRPSAYINSPVLNAALASEQHRESLREFRFFSDYLVSWDLFNELLKLLQSLKRLERLHMSLKVQGLDKKFDILRYLPESMKEFDGDLRDGDVRLRSSFP